jgi:hypothetical protein
MTESLYPIHSASIDAKAVRALRDAGCESVVIGIPWDMIFPHGEQARANHGQGLIRLMQRGGIDANEAVNILTGQGNRNRLSPDEANRKLAGMISLWRARQSERLDGMRHAEAIEAALREGTPA